MTLLRKTKIVATIGPATKSIEALMDIMQAGVDVCRVNCSHCNAQEIRSSVANIRRAAATLGRSVSILLDLQGPKIRTGEHMGELDLKKGDTNKSTHHLFLDPFRPCNHSNNFPFQLPNVSECKM